MKRRLHQLLHGTSTSHFSFSRCRLAFIAQAGEPLGLIQPRQVQSLTEQMFVSYFYLLSANNFAYFPSFIKVEFCRPDPSIPSKYYIYLLRFFTSFLLHPIDSMRHTLIYRIIDTTELPAKHSNNCIRPSRSPIYGIYLPSV